MKKEACTENIAFRKDLRSAFGAAQMKLGHERFDATIAQEIGRRQIR